MADKDSSLSSREPAPAPPRTEAIHGYFGLSYCNYLVLHRSLLQSMPDDWQDCFVDCLEQLDEAFAHIEQPAEYDVRCLARPRSLIRWEPCGNCNGGFVQPGYRCDDCNGEGEVECDRYETAEEVGFVTDPVPHYNRGRTRLPLARESERAQRLSEGKEGNTSSFGSSGGERDA